MAVVDNIENLTKEEFDDYVERLINGEDTAEQTPEQTPEETPEQTPEETPEETPEQAPAQAAEPDERLVRLSDIARAKYPDKSGEEAMVQLLEDMEREEGENRGLDAESFRRAQTEEREYDAWREERAQRERQEQAAAQTVRAWREDEARLRTLIPSFSLEKAFENEEFKRRVAQNGESVFEAYAAMNPKKEEKKRAAVDEAGLSAQAGGQEFKEADVTRMPRKQFDEYIRRIKEGERN